MAPVQTRRSRKLREATYIDGQHNTVIKELCAPRTDGSIPILNFLENTSKFMKDTQQLHDRIGSLEKENIQLRVMEEKFSHMSSYLEKLVEILNETLPEEKQLHYKVTMSSEMDEQSQASSTKSIPNYFEPIPKTDVHPFTQFHAENYLQLTDLESHEEAKISEFELKHLHNVSGGKRMANVEPPEHSDITNNAPEPMMSSESRFKGSRMKTFENNKEQEESGPELLKKHRKSQKNRMSSWEILQNQEKNNKTMHEELLKMESLTEELKQIVQEEPTTIKEKPQLTLKKSRKSEKKRHFALPQGENKQETTEKLTVSLLSGRTTEGSYAMELSKESKKPIYKSSSSKKAKDYSLKKASRGAQLREIYENNVSLNKRMENEMKELESLRAFLLKDNDDEEDSEI